jgi:hypothetical protein
MRAARVVLERRSKTYVLGPDKTSEGWEIVRETLAHPECASLTDGKVRSAEEAVRKAAAGGATIADAVEIVQPRLQTVQEILAERAAVEETMEVMPPVVPQVIEEAKPAKAKRKRKKVSAESEE